MKPLTIEQRDKVLKDLMAGMVREEACCGGYIHRVHVKDALNANTEESNWRLMDIEKDIDRLVEQPKQESKLCPDCGGEIGWQECATWYGCKDCGWKKEKNNG